MASWRDIEAAEPAFAAAVQALFDAHRHKTMATLRKDGSPRISGIECGFEDGELWLGMMPDSLKLRDVQRDPRVAIHSASDEPDAPGGWPGDAKLAGRLVEVEDESEMHRLQGQSGSLFRLDITEVSKTTLGTPADHLLIETWSPGRGLRSIKRK